MLKNDFKKVSNAFDNLCAEVGTEDFLRCVFNFFNIDDLCELCEYVGKENDIYISEEGDVDISKAYGDEE